MNNTQSAPATPAVAADLDELQRRARLAAEAGDQLLAPNNQLPSGHPALFALELYRQSAYWAALALAPELASAEPSLLWQKARARPEFGEKLPGEALFSLLEAPFTAGAELTRQEQLAAAEQLRAYAAELLSASRRPAIEREWLKVKRVLLIGLALVAVGMLISVVVLVWPRPPDLAAGKPWRASSEMVHCEPLQATCGGATTRIFFHTKEEAQPWVRFDLGAPAAFSWLTVKNRSDYGQERAVPLVAEVSNDDEHFTQVARREEPFDTWEPHFAKQNARYVRLRVARTSMLHLEAVEVHP